MSLLHESERGDQHLVRYLLGLLPDEDTDHLDEMSIADDEVAARLRVVETDLVDAYVSGSLAGETLVRFESFYLSSPHRRQNVKFAESFLRAVDRAAARADHDARRDPIRAPWAGPDRSSSRGAASSPWLVPRSTSAWGLAAAAALLLVVCGGLLLQDVRLRNGLDEAQKESAALSRRGQELEQQLENQRAASAEAARELERARAVLTQQSAAPPPAAGTRTASPVLATTALVLLPQTRAIGPIAELAVPPGTDHVKFELRLESNDFPRYEVALKDPATGRIEWRSARIPATSPGDEPTVSITLPASMLKPQHYSLDLIGRSAGGAPEIVGSYTVRILPR